MLEMLRADNYCMQRVKKAREWASYWWSLFAERNTVVDKMSHFTFNSFLSSLPRFSLKCWKWHHHLLIATLEKICKRGGDERRGWIFFPMPYVETMMHSKKWVFWRHHQSIALVLWSFIPGTDLPAWKCSQPGLSPFYSSEINFRSQYAVVLVHSLGGKTTFARQTKNRVERRTRSPC